MIAIASDHAGFPLKEEIKKFLEEKNIEVEKNVEKEEWKDTSSISEV